MIRGGYEHESPEAVACYLADQRRAGVRRAVDLIVEGRRGRALYELVRSVELQARIAAGGGVVIPMSVPAAVRAMGPTRRARLDHVGGQS